MESLKQKSCSRLIAALFGVLLAACTAACVRATEPPQAAADPWKAIIDAVPPLPRPQGKRPPLFLWSPDLPAGASDEQLEATLRALQARGLSPFLRWHHDRAASMRHIERVATILKRIGMPVVIDATPISLGLFPPSGDLSHRAADGSRFRGSGLAWDPGCPFAIGAVNEGVRGGMDAYAKAHADAGVPLDYWISDWELDGPNEWKQNWTLARKCVTCREKIPDIDTNFTAFQAAVRTLRSEMQRKNFVEPVVARFPGVKIGNYAMNPHDGHRYYWDYYEEDAFGKPNLTDGIPYRRDQGAIYRPWWAGEFEASGYTLAAPVMYPWYHLFLNYDFTDIDYRWFYGILLEASSVGRHTPAGTPLVPFIHWGPVVAFEKPEDQPAGFAGLSEEKYRELLWHLLLRGVDSFIPWAPGDEPRELKPVHAVYAESLEYPEFFEHGTPVVFAVPDRPGTVVSALKANGRLLVRRTDFVPDEKPVSILVDGREIAVPAAPGRCQVLPVD
jgi:hypothetical protein